MANFQYHLLLRHFIWPRTVRHCHSNYHVSFLFWFHALLFSILFLSWLALNCFYVVRHTEKQPIWLHLEAALVGFRSTWRTAHMTGQEICFNWTDVLLSLVQSSALFVVLNGNQLTQLPTLTKSAVSQCVSEVTLYVLFPTVVRAVNLKVTALFLGSFSPLWVYVFGGVMPVPKCAECETR